jgi:hypothetical protein
MSVAEQISNLSFNVYEDNHEDTKCLAAITFLKNGKVL